GGARRPHPRAPPPPAAAPPPGPRRPPPPPGPGPGRRRGLDAVAHIDADLAEAALRMMERNMSAGLRASGEVTFEDVPSN
ncbi:hypothetical protein M2167_006624, partial [Streptomyces sp. SPB4]|nr:hypothetical protein [Streptomyces sp. SPB4]